MSNMRDLKRRIKSTQNMQQITKAMKAVAAAKMRKAQEAVILARPYAKRVHSVLGRVGSASGGVSNPLLQVRAPKKVAYVVMAADRGLCGGFNSNVLRHAFQELKGLDVEISIITIGRKSLEYFRRRSFPIVQNYPGLVDSADYASVKRISSHVTEMYAGLEYDAVYLVYSQFINAIVQKPLTVKLLPAEPPQEATGTNDTRVSYIFEPSPEEVLAELLPKSIENAIYQGLLETRAGFYSAQMAAMENATKSATEIIDDLTMSMNRARQAQITTELTEIVSGAAALE